MMYYIKCDVLSLTTKCLSQISNLKDSLLNNLQFKTKHPRYNFCKANFVDIENIFSKLLCEFEKSAEPVEPTWNEIENSIKRALETIPGKLSRPKGHPWVDRDIVRMIRRRDRMFKRNCRFPSIPHELEYDNLCLDLKKRMRYARTH